MFQKVGLKAIEASAIHNDAWLTSTRASNGGILMFDIYVLVEEREERDEREVVNLCLAEPASSLKVFRPFTVGTT